MTLDEMYNTYDIVGKIRDGFELLGKNWDDTQRILVMSGIESDAEETVSLFTKLLASKFCLRIVRLLMICAAEAIAVAVALSFQDSIFVERILLILSPFFAKLTVDGVLDNFLGNVE